MQPSTTSAQALQNLQSFQSGMKSPQDVLTGANQQLGVPQAQQQVQGLRGAIQNTTNLLNQVAPSVMGRTQNSLVTSAQANNQIAQEEAPISTQLNKEQSDYSSANQDYTNLEQQAQNEANATLQDQQSRLGTLQSVYGDLAAKEQQDQANQLAQKQLQDQEAQQAYANAHPSGGTAAPNANSGYKMTRNTSGGLAFSDSSGNPVTAGRFVSQQGGTFTDLRNILAQSNDPTDQKIVQEMDQGVPAATLEQQYPYVFGGI